MMSEYPEMNSPSFRLEEDEKNEKLFLHYYSFRKGFHPLVIGLYLFTYIYIVTY